MEISGAVRAASQKAEFMSAYHWNLSWLWSVVLKNCFQNSMSSLATNTVVEHTGPLIKERRDTHK